MFVEPFEGPNRPDLETRWHAHLDYFLNDLVKEGWLHG